MSYNPNQPREPKGVSTGGQWTSEQIGTAVKSARKAAGLNNPVIKSTEDSPEPVYVINDASNLDEYKTIVVSEDGSEVYASKGRDFHSSLIMGVGKKGETVDDYVRFSHSRYNDYLSASITSAGINIDEGYDGEIRAENNIVRALKVLVHKGLSRKTKIRIDNGQTSDFYTYFTVEELLQ